MGNFLKVYYIEVIHWQIKLAISIIKRNEYPNQLEYWKNSLKDSLIERNAMANKINNENSELFHN